MKRIVVSIVPSGFDVVVRVGDMFDIVADMKQARKAADRMIYAVAEEDDYFAVDEELANEFAEYLEENEKERPNWFRFENLGICIAMEDHVVTTMTDKEHRETRSMARDYRHQCQ